jgi:hypothetical protein
MNTGVHQPPRDSSRGKSYRRPTITVLGSVSSLTLGTTGSGTDGGSGMTGMN